MTLLTEVEAIINTRPLTYIYEEFKSNFVLTPSHFLIGSFNNAIPFATEDKYDDTEYIPTLDSTQSLLQYWRRNQKQLQFFWRKWRKGYLLTLRETLPLEHRGPKSQVRRTPEIGEIVILRDDDLPRRMWKLAKVTELIRGRDSQIRAAKVKLPNKNILERSINYLYPLEIKSITPNKEDKEELSDSNVEDSSTPIKRAAAVEARNRISRLLRDDQITGVFFCVSPGSVMN